MLPSSQRLDWRRIGIFLGFAYGIAWAGALYLHPNGGLYRADQVATTVGPVLAPRAFVVLAGVYMTAPAVAHMLTRIVTREGWHGLWLRPNFRPGWPYWVAAWILPSIATFVGIGLYFMLFPAQFDSELTVVRQMLEQTGQKLPLTPMALLGVQILQAVLIAPVLNAIPTLGEEFGWRAYLQPKLMVLGWRRAMVLMGLVWGVWHWPVIAMGYNYGRGYPGAPWTGMLVFLWFTFVVGTVLGWLTIRGRSVWPAVIGHGALNGIGALPVLLVTGETFALLGPAPVGLIGSIGFTLVAGWMLLNPPGTQAANAVP